MNSFRDSIGKPPQGPVMAAKKPRARNEEERATGFAVPRGESRTHNQRTEDRQVRPTEEARLFVNRKSYVVDLLNLSGGGAMIRTNLPLKLWATVQLELAEGDCVECAVRWIKGDRIGLEFAHETQVAGDTATRDAMLLDAIARNFPAVAEDEGEAAIADDSEATGSQRRGEYRHPLIWSGHIHFEFESTRVRVRNIAEHGAMIDCNKAIGVGSEVLLDLGGAGQLFAFVSWARGDQLGLKFQRPFDIKRLAQSKPDVAPQSWSRPDYLEAGQDMDSPWAEPWQRLSVPELKDRLEGFLKR